MFNRRTLLLSLLAVPLPAAAALAQPWWNEKAENAQWERYKEEERRHREGRHQSWDERHEHEAWERRQREMAQRDWERDHEPGRR